VERVMMVQLDQALDLQSNFGARFKKKLAEDARSLVAAFVRMAARLLS
jgi:hypothetical protein